MDGKCICVSNTHLIEESFEYWYIGRLTFKKTKAYCTLHNAKKQSFNRQYYNRRHRGGMLLIDFENNNEIGGYLKLTNTYCLVTTGRHSNFDRINVRVPVIPAEIAGCRIVGRLCVGNKYGLVVPDKITDLELNNLRNNLPDAVKISCVEERLSALGNVAVCNDRIALIHEDIDKATEDIIRDTLNVEVFRSKIGKQMLVGSYSIFNNYGGLVHSKITKEEIEDLSELLDLPLVAGTVRSGSDTVGSSLSVNDYFGFVGKDCRPHELQACERALNLQDL